MFNSTDISPEKLFYIIHELSLAKTDVYKVIYCIDKNMFLKATRRRYKHRSIKAPIEILVTIGRPNFAERKCIKKFPKFNHGFVAFKHLKNK